MGDPMYLQLLIHKPAFQRQHRAHTRVHPEERVAAAGAREYRGRSARKSREVLKWFGVELPREKVKTKLPSSVCSLPRRRKLVQHDDDRYVSLLGFLLGSAGTAGR